MRQSCPIKCLKVTFAAERDAPGTQWELVQRTLRVLSRGEWVSAVQNECLKTIYSLKNETAYFWLIFMQYCTLSLTKCLLSQFSLYHSGRKSTKGSKVIVNGPDGMKKQLVRFLVCVFPKIGKISSVAAGHLSSTTAFYLIVPISSTCPCTWRISCSDTTDKTLINSWHVCSIPKWKTSKTLDYKNLSNWNDKYSCSGS